MVHSKAASARGAAKRSGQASAPWWRRRGVIGLIAAAALLVAGGLIFADWYVALPESTVAVYVGRQSCVECHQQEAQLYAGSHHDRAMDLATPATVLGDFSGVTLQHFDVLSRMYRDGERYLIDTEGPDGKPSTFEVKYVLGYSPLQNYMVEMDRPEGMPEDEISRVQVLRIAWDTLQKKWFYLPPPDVATKLGHDDELHWCGITQRWNTSCADCHSTNLQKGFNPETLTYHTTFSEIDVSCEACHGPGSTHVTLARSYSLFWDRKRGYGLTNTLKGTEAEREIQTCAPCHARREVLAGGYAAGDDYWDHFATATLAPLLYHADGQIEDEVFEHGSFLQSRMYHKGIRCTDCHDPHTAKLKHDGNQVCTSCHQHPAGKYDSPLHHHHQNGSAGASCVGCHMPQTTYMELHARRDHSLRVPRPDLSVALGTPNACTACHLDQAKLREAVTQSGGKTDPGTLKQYGNFLQAARQGDVVIQAELARLDRWAGDYVGKWYQSQPNRQHNTPHFASAFAAAERYDPQAAEKLQEIIGDRQLPAIVRASALERWRDLDTAGLLDASTRHLRDPHPLVRGAAAQNVALLADDTGRAKLLSPLLADETFAVRRAAARGLADLSTKLGYDDREALRLVLREWVDGLMTHNDRAGAYLALGNLELQRRNLREAETAYRNAIRVEPFQFGPRSQLANYLEALAADGLLPGTALNEAVRLRDEDFELLRRDVERAPEIAALQYQYGLLLAQRNNLPGARRAFQKALAIEPTNPIYQEAARQLSERK